MLCGLAGQKKWLFHEGLDVSENLSKCWGLCHGLDGLMVNPHVGIHHSVVTGGQVLYVLKSYILLFPSNLFWIHT